MPSRKRTKGKERKAKKAEAEAENHKALVRYTWQGLARGEDYNDKIVLCSHGLNVTIPDDGHPVSKFIDSLFFAKSLKNVFEMHPQLFNNESDREMAATLLVSIAVTNLLQPQGYDGLANFAYAIVMLENCDETDDFNSVVCKQPVSAKIRDLKDSSNDRDLLNFFSKRIACSCLKEMHSVARKTLPKLGKCFHCEEVKERSMLMVCSGCKVGQYCSVECQVAEWPEHQSDCRDYVNANIK